MGKRIYRSGIDDLRLISNREIRNCNYFCLHCLSSYIYYRSKTKDYRCRKCGALNNVSDFKEELEHILKRSEKMLMNVIVYNE